MGQVRSCFIVLSGIFLFAACKNPVANKWNTGVALYSFNKFPMNQALAMADSAGVSYVEGFSFHQLGKEFGDRPMSNISDDDISRVKKMLAEKSLQMKSMYVGGAKDINEWKYYFELARQLDMEFLVCEPEKYHWNMIDSLAGLYKIKIAIHQHARGLSAYWHPDSVLAAIKGHQNIGTCADLGHWARSGLDAVKCLQQLKGTILGIHLKDIDVFGNIKANDVTVGTGAINFRDIVKELKTQNYKGMVYVECEHSMENNLSDVKESVVYLEDLAK